MNRMSRLKKNLEILQRYWSARLDLYGRGPILDPDCLHDLHLVTEDGGRTFITAEHWAGKHGGIESEELIEHMRGDSKNLILQRRIPREEIEQFERDADSLEAVAHFRTCHDDVFARLEALG
jgi:hypothetical protein